jgi:hypothetical protein
MIVRSKLLHWLGVVTPVVGSSAGWRVEGTGKMEKGHTVRKKERTMKERRVVQLKEEGCQSRGETTEIRPNGKREKTLDRLLELARCSSKSDAGPRMKSDDEGWIRQCSFFL